ncbi:aminotransferase class IV [Paracoccus aestuariivivens]|uniref:Probable branched-chain-amino-acid aminotransferase n=1 Tax=Paracoccus aestuariivivens TaxID=1820333 RepID=A0A6L6JD22_9RHOB|nr:aminotransferase class IV [Paracoccus aestuariivivens]
MESPLRDAADGADLALIETARWDGSACPLLDLHLARLQAGIRALGWRFDGSFAAAFIGPQDRPARLRVLVRQNGIVPTETSDLPPAIPIWRVGIAEQRLDSADPWLRIKSTRRATYDQARRTLSTGLHEVILLNERHEVCDGSISTVFFDRGEGLRTPPLTSGLLPGVLRAKLMSEGVPEEVLLAQDLPKVRLWVGNALRGLHEAILVR